MRTSNYRKIMENHLGRKLTKDECIHHINFNHSDNRLENLQIVSRAQHRVIHTVAVAESRMRRINVYLNEDSYQYLKSRHKTKLSEHIRWAVSEYVHKLRQEDVRLERSASESESKGGEK